MVKIERKTVVVAREIASVAASCKTEFINGLSNVRTGH